MAAVMTASNDRHRELRYRDPCLYPSDRIREILVLGDDADVREALIGFALYGEDRSFAEWASREVVRTRSADLYDLPPICLSHVARRWGDLEAESWRLLDSLRRRPELEAWVDEFVQDIEWQVRLAHETAGQARRRLLVSWLRLTALDVRLAIDRTARRIWSLARR